MEQKTKLSEMNLFRPPAAARAAKKLDRSLFLNIVPTAAASIAENSLIPRYRKELEQTSEIFSLEKLHTIVPDPDPTLAAQGRRCVLLKPDVKPQSPETWSSVLRQGVDQGHLKIVPFDLHLGYKLWSYMDVMRSVLPEDLQDEIPSGFNTAGHVAHLNLREQYLPYKYVIAETIVDKNPGITTVINKIDNVGSANEFRTFQYEVLAGPDDLLVEVSEADCIFKFDYAQVYWNTKLSTEHQRLAGLFKPGEVVADVMAGVGPFAVPAGKKGVFVWANDKNPESYKWLTEATRRNKVTQFVKPFNYDGHDFIPKAADLVLEASRNGEFASVPPAKVSRKSDKPRPPPTQVPIPPTISHFVMNLPAMALEFLHNFRGVYHGHEGLFAPHTEAQLPTVHAHCFAIKGDMKVASDEICQRIFNEIGVMLKPGEMDKEGEVYIHEVRDVAPAKSMFCASFRLPAQVAFAARS